MTEDQTARLLALLEDGTLDLVLLALPYQAGDLETLPLFHDGFHLVARKDNPLAQKKSVTLADLKDANLLLLADGHCLRDHALAACRLTGADSGFAGASLNTLVEMVAGDLGVTLLPDMAVSAHVPRAANWSPGPSTAEPPARPARRTADRPGLAPYLHPRGGVQGVRRRPDQGGEKRQDRRFLNFRMPLPAGPATVRRMIWRRSVPAMLR